MIINNMDLGEFFTVRRFVQLAIPLGFFLIITFSDEFLAVRALGLFLLLAASPVLAAAFLEAPLSRLLLPILAYVWIIRIDGVLQFALLLTSRKADGQHGFTSGGEREGLSIL
jgi:hypothetical protein